MLAVILLLAASPITNKAEAHHQRTYEVGCIKKYSGVSQTKCLIKRAAEHFGQSYSYALSVAWCESRYNPFANNSGKYLGLYQFDYATWQGAPWRNKSRYSARYSALNAMWYWRIGQISRWECA